MAITLYEITIPVLVKHVKTLKYLLSKGSADSKVEDQKLLDSRLIADMGNLIFQSMCPSSQVASTCV